MGRTYRWIAICCISTLALSGCGRKPSSSVGVSPSAASTGSTTSGPAVLEGIWESRPVTSAEVDAFMRDRYTDHQVDEWEKTDCFPRGDQVAVKTLHFGAGALVISNATDGGPTHERWTGTYVVKDADTYLAGDAAVPYITVNFILHGDRLSPTLIEDRFPDHTPWHKAVDGQVLDIGKPLSDEMCQTVIYDVSDFTRVG